MYSHDLLKNGRKTSRRLQQIFTTVTCLLVLICSTPAASAQEFNWGPDPVNTDWFSILNWDTDTMNQAVPSGSDDSVVISVQGSGIYPELISNVTIGELTLGENAELIADGFDFSVVPGTSTSGNAFLGANSFIEVVDAVVAFNSIDGSGVVNLSGASLLSIGQLGDGGGGDFTGRILGTGGLMKVGPDTLSLNVDGVQQNHTYSGPTEIVEGTLRLFGAARLPNATTITVHEGATYEIDSVADAVWGLNGDGDVQLNGTALFIVGNTGNAGGVGDFSGSMFGPGQFEKRGTGTQTLSGPNFYDGDTIVTEGTLQLTGDGSLNDVSSVNIGPLGTLQLDSVVDAVWELNGSGDLQLNGDSVIIVGEFGNDGGTGDFSGMTFGTGAFEKRGSGTQIVSAPLTHSGDTIVSEGILRMNLGARISDFSTIEIGQDGTLEMVSIPDAVWGLNGSGNLDIDENSLLAVGNFNNDGGIGDFSGVISGLGEFQKRGQGTQTLTGINTYSGDTIVSQGTLRIGDGGRLSEFTTVDVSLDGTLEYDSISDEIWGLNGSGDVQLNGSTLVVGNFGNAGGVGSFSGIISGTGTFEKRGSGTQTLSGGNTYSGDTIVTEGELHATSSTIQGTISDFSTLDVRTGATFRLSNPSFDAVWGLNGSGDVQLDGTTILTVGNFGNDGGVGSFDGVISGSGSFEKRGSGIQTLSGENTYTGDTIVTEGELRAASSNLNGLISDLSTLDVRTGATFRLDVPSFDAVWGLQGLGDVILEGASKLVVGNFGNAGGVGNFSGEISGTGNFEKRGAGTQIFSGINSYPGETIITEGKLQIATDDSLNDESPVSVAAAGTFELLDATDSVWSLNGAGNLLLTGDSRLILGNTGNDGGEGEFSGRISGAGAFEKRGSGVQILNRTSFQNNHNYTGDTIVTEGILRVEGLTRLPDTTTIEIGPDGTLELISIPDAVWGLNGSGKLVVDESSFLAVGNNNNNGGVGTFSGTIEDGGAIEKRGTGTFRVEGNNTYSGGTIVSQGVMEVANSIGSGTGTGDVEVESAGTLVVDGGIIVSNLMTVSGTVQMNDGLLDLEALILQPGNTFGVSSGRLVADNVNGDLQLDGGVLGIGDSPGLMTVNGDLTLQTGATLEVEIMGTDPGVEFDQVQVSGDVMLGGALALVIGSSLDFGQEFEIVQSAGTLSGEFAGIGDGDIITTNNGAQLLVNYQSNALSLFVLVESNGVLLGDVNLDGVVNLLDVGPFIELISTSEFQVEADCNEDGIVNLLDVGPFIEILSGS